MMNIYVRMILEELFKRVNVPIDNIEEIIKEAKWNTKYTWSKKDSDNFVLWLINFLKNKNAFMALSEKPFNKINRHIIACKFEEKYGWKKEN